MNFKFYPFESRLFDFLEFPGLILDGERYSTSSDEDDFRILHMEEYSKLVNSIKTRLDPYRSEIEIFYTKEFFGDYDFIELITKPNGIFGHNSEEDYLNELLSLDEHDINRSIAYSIIASTEDSNEYSEAIMCRAKDMSTDKGGLISIIKELPIDSSIKWNLFLIVEEPIKYMKIYVDLMLKLLPVFRDVYLTLEERVNTYGEYLEDYFNKNGTKGLEEKSYSMLNSKIISEDTNKILVSAIVQFVLAISTKGKDGYVCWGLEIEKLFQVMKEHNENKVNERVQVFKNLGDKTRYEVVKLIALSETSTKDIANALGVSSATISYHINNLLQARIIRLDRVESKYSYVIDYEFLENSLKGLKKDLNFPQ